MVGKHVAQFQSELALAKALEELRCKPPMPYGYPIGVYRPKHIRRVPRVRAFIRRMGGRLRNGVPRVLGFHVVENYPLGTYNPWRKAVR